MSSKEACRGKIKEFSSKKFPQARIGRLKPIPQGRIRRLKPISHSISDGS